MIGNNGSLTPIDAANNNVAKKFIHDDIYQIEQEIRKASEINQRKLTVNFTPITNNTLESFQTVGSVNTTDDEITITGHGLVSDDIVVIKSSDTLPAPLVDDVFYGVIVEDVNIIQLYDLGDVDKVAIDITSAGVGTIEARKVNTSEIFLRSWEKFYTFPFSDSYIFIMENIEEYFRKSGFKILRLKDATTNTLKWVISW